MDFQDVFSKKKYASVTVNILISALILTLTMALNQAFTIIFHRLFKSDNGVILYAFLLLIVTIVVIHITTKKFILNNGMIPREK